MARRFASANTDEIGRILSEKDSANTKKATEAAVKVFKLYLREKELPEDFENYDKKKLDKVMSKFFVEVRRADGEAYKKSTLSAIRNGLNRYLLSNSEHNLSNREDFKESCIMYRAMGKELKRIGIMIDYVGLIYCY